jgi:hypothetical protein
MAANGDALMRAWGRLTPVHGGAPLGRPRAGGAVQPGQVDSLAASRAQSRAQSDIGRKFGPNPLPGGSGRLVRG